MKLKKFVSLLAFEKSLASARKFKKKVFFWLIPSNDLARVCQTMEIEGTRRGSRPGDRKLQSFNIRVS